MSLEERRKLVDVELAKSGTKRDRLSIVKQCEVLDIRRSGFYYTATPTDEEDLRVMRVMDELHMEDPCMGTRMLSKELRAKGIMAGRARVRRLMRLMRIKAVYCVPRTTVIDSIKYKHPYLLRGLEIDRRNQVWSVDITYLPVRGGFMYMVAVIDVHTRYLLNWSISNSMEAAWVTAMITEAIAMHGRPEIINSDQGSQFTSEEYTALFRKGGVAEGVKISMDGKGRAIDNVFIERFWRTLKHDHLYLAPPTDGLALYQSCERFVDRYNHRRLHSSLDYRTPAACYHMAA
jgi:putative transposase